jgi:hypothetical protein
MEVICRADLDLWGSGWVTTQVYPARVTLRGNPGTWYEAPGCPDRPIIGTTPESILSPLHGSPHVAISASGEPM